MASARTQPVDPPVALVARIEETPPIAIASISVLIGVLLVVGSLVAGVNSFSINGKHLGYWYAVNWSLNYVLVIPIAIYFAANTFTSIRELISDLASSGMIVTREGQLIPEKDILGYWHQFSKRGTAIALIMSAIAFIASWIEFYISFIGIRHHISDIGQPGGPILGWTLAQYVGSTSAVRAEPFGFVAFTAQACVASIFLIFVTMILICAAWIFDFTSNRTEQELVPDIKSTDLRRGFELFEPLMVNLLLASCFFFGVFFLIRLDNAFVLSSHSSILDFAARDLGQGFFSHGSFSNISRSQLEIPNDQIYYSLMMAGTGMGVTMFTAFLVPSFILSQGAKISRNRAIANLARLRLRERTGVPEDEIRTRLNNMSFWPLQYPRPAELMLFLLLGGACFVYYDLTLFLVGALVGRSVLLFLGVATGTKGSH